MYERQFVIAHKDYLEEYAWPEIAIESALFLKYHPLLNCTEANYEGKRLILIGYILDPNNSGLSDLEILNELLISSADINVLTKATEKLCGRFVMIFKNKSLFIFSDAYGLRSLFYAFDDNGHLLCASQPGHIAKALNLKYSGIIKMQYFNSQYYKTNKEYWLPSGISLYEKVKHLVPNHYLDCKLHKQIRYWPRERKSSNSPNSIVKGCTQILKNIIKAAHARFELALPLTSGYDSRLLLAASKEIADKIYYYTLKYDKLNDNSPDIVIPKEILNHLGIAHHLFDCSGVMDKQYSEYYRQNVELSHPYYGNIAFGMKTVIPPNKVAIKGVSEVTRAFFYKISKNNGYDLAKLMSMESCDFIISTFQSWLDDSEEVILNTDYKLLDIFYWEHRLGSWRAMAALEFDIIHEIIDPFNCRYLLELLLSVDEKFRIGEYPLLRMIIAELWPDLLKYPINPLYGKSKLKETFKNISIKVGAYEQLSKYYEKVKRLN